MAFVIGDEIVEMLGCETLFGILVVKLPTVPELLPSEFSANPR